MTLIKESDDFDMIVEHHIPSAAERRKICSYIDKLQKQDKLSDKENKVKRQRNHKLKGLTV